MNTWDSHVMGVWFDGLPMAVFHRNPSIYFMVTSAFILNWTISLAAEIREDFANVSSRRGLLFVLSNLWAVIKNP